MHHKRRWADFRLLGFPFFGYGGRGLCLDLFERKMSAMSVIFEADIICLKSWMVGRVVCLD